jgi:2'-5' RNA ligase
MNLKNKVRKALLKPKREYDYNCVMIGVKLDTEEWKNIQDMISDDDLYMGEDNENYGREWNPHVTILYGIHPDVKDDDVEKLIKKIKKVNIKFGKVSFFTDKMFDVLKFDIESLDLHKLNTMFKKLPYTSEYPNYHPHMTICYLKAGLAKKYLKKLSDTELTEGVLDEVIYSKSDGTKKKYLI